MMVNRRWLAQRSM